MRIYLACLVLMFAPMAAVVGYKYYEAERSQQLPVEWHTRGEVLFFNASWCGPCKQMRPIVSSLRREGYRLRDVDVDRDRDLAEKYGIRSVPTFVFVENGGEVDRFVGGTTAEHLRRLCSASAYR
jgi:thioredoxin 1